MKVSKEFKTVAALATVDSDGNAINYNLITNESEILKALGEKSISTSEKFILPIGKYKFVKIEVADSGTSKTFIVVLEDSKGDLHMTTMGSLMKLDSTRKAYCPQDVTNSNWDIIFQDIKAKGLSVETIVDSTVIDWTGYVRGSGAPAPTATKAAKFMKWSFGK